MGRKKAQGQKGAPPQDRAAAAAPAGSPSPRRQPPGPASDGGPPSLASASASPSPERGGSAVRDVAQELDQREALARQQAAEEEHQRNKGRAGYQNFRTSRDRERHAQEGEEAVQEARRALAALTAPGVVTDSEAALKVAQDITAARWAVYYLSGEVFPREYPPPPAGDGADVFAALDEGGEGVATRKEIAKYLMRNQTLRHRLREGWARFNENFSTEDVSEVDRDLFCQLWQQAANLRADAPAPGSPGAKRVLRPNTATESNTPECVELSPIRTRGGASVGVSAGICVVTALEDLAVLRGAELLSAEEFAECKARVLAAALAAAAPARRR